MIVNGRSITKEILAQVRKEAGELPEVPVVRAIVLAPSAATESYLNIKKRRAEDAGMRLELVRLADDATTEDVIHAISIFGANAIIVQLPLPESVDAPRILNAIPVSRDADVLSMEAQTRFREGDGQALLPPVVSAIEEILVRSKVSLVGRRVVVVGQGKLVGEPAALWLVRKGAQVTTITKEEGNLSMLKEAEIIVSGAGSPGLIRPEHLAPGVVLIDAGTSESDGSIVGDADPACAELASVFTPVPGGVGPIAVACLFRNAVLLAKRGGLHTL